MLLAIHIAESVKSKLVVAMEHSCGQGSKLDHPLNYKPTTPML